LKLDLLEPTVDIKQRNTAKATRQDKMTIAQENETLLCTHCGVTLDADEELCRSCGKLVSVPCPSRNTLKRETLVRFFPWLRNKFIQSVDHDKFFKEDPIIDPEFSPLSGNIYNEDEK
jgi:predicted amidophosphoribosyltransferase